MIIKVLSKYNICVSCAFRKSNISQNKYYTFKILKFMILIDKATLEVLLSMHVHEEKYFLI